MFRKIKNIDTAFRYTRSISIAVILFTLVLNCYSLYKGFASAENASRHIYVLIGGHVMEAYLTERKDNLPVELRDHIGTFMTAFFTLDPDEKAINQNLSKAYYLADASAKHLSDNLRESGYFTNIVAANISQRIQIDSIQLDMRQNPVSFRCFAKEMLIRSTTILERQLVTEGRMRLGLTQTDNNPHGFLIEQLAITDNHDLRTVNR